MIAVYEAVVDVDGDGHVEAVVVGVGFAEGDFGDGFVAGEVAHMGNGGEFDPGDGGVVDDVGTAGFGDPCQARRRLDSGDLPLAVLCEDGEILFIWDEGHSKGVVGSADGGRGVNAVVHHRLAFFHPDT